MDYMRKEWRTDNRPVPMDEARLNELLRQQAKDMKAMKAIHDKK